MVIDAIKKMTAANVGSLMVVDCEGQDVCRHKEEAVVGIMTERDYLTKVVVKGRNSHSTKVCDIMTPGTLFWLRFCQCSCLFCSPNLHRLTCDSLNRKNNSERSGHGDAVE